MGYSIWRACVIIAFLSVCNPGVAGTVNFRLAFHEGPGSEAIRAGDVRSAIRLLEEQLAEQDRDDRGEILATLCGAYIIVRSFDQATDACNQAVETAPTDVAYNNRGVLRAHLGDLDGARVDFDRVRPQYLDVYLEELWGKDVSLIAEDNFGVANELLTRGTTVAIRGASSRSPAEVEEIGN